MVRQSKILGPDGSPVMVSELADEIATPTVAGVRRIAEERVSSGLTPERLGAILRDAQSGEARAYLTLAEEMEERYLHYASVLQTRRLVLEGVPATVEAPKGVPTKITDAVTELVEDGAFLEGCAALLDGIGKGYAAVELGWEFRDGLLRPERLTWRDPRYFQFDKVRLDVLRMAEDGVVDGVELPPARFAVHMPRTRTGIPIRRGVARAASWAYMVQSFALQDWAAFCEVYGMPFRVGKYGPGASEADKRALLRAVSSIANDAAAIIPESMLIDFHEVTGSQGEKVFGSLIDYTDNKVSLVVLGQTMTSEDGSSYGQAKIHDKVRLDIAQADARQLAQTVNRDIVRWFVSMNFGPQALYPRVEWPITEPEDMAAISSAVATLVPLGLKVSQREMRDKLGLSEPQSDDEVLAAPAKPEPPTGGLPAPTKPTATPPKVDPTKALKGDKPARLAAHVVGCRCGGCLKVDLLAPRRMSAEPIVDGPDEVEAVLEDVLADWEDITDPLLDPLRDVLLHATSFEEALAMLEAKGPDGSKLAEALAAATSIARGIGDVRD